MLQSYFFLTRFVSIAASGTRRFLFPLLDRFTANGRGKSKITKFYFSQTIFSTHVPVTFRYDIFLLFLVDPNFDVADSYYTSKRRPVLMPRLKSR